MAKSTFKKIENAKIYEVHFRDENKLKYIHKILAYSTEDALKRSKKFFGTNKIYEVNFICTVKDFSKKA